MLFSSDDLIRYARLEATRTRLVRHSRDGLRAWRRGPEHLADYASIQRPGAKSPFNGALHALQFVPGPTLPGGEQSALFVGAHAILDEWAWGDGSRRPRTMLENTGNTMGPTIAAYDLEEVPELEEFAGRVLVRWGTAASSRAWSQWAHRKPKEIVELWRSASEPPFPGFAKFSCLLSELETLPVAWLAALESVGGVYLLVCDSNGQQYVGSASGVRGFLGRWESYAATGHGGNALLKQRGVADYRIAILEVCSTDMGPAEVLAREIAWKGKLGSRVHGLNAN